MTSTTHQATVSDVDLPIINDGLKEPLAESYQEGKANRANNNAVITLTGSFILMSLVSLVACTLFPTPSTQHHNSASTLDMTPMITPVQMMGFN